MRAFLIGITLLITTGFILPALAEENLAQPADKKTVIDTEVWTEEEIDELPSIEKLIKQYCPHDPNFRFKQEPLNYIVKNIELPKNRILITSKGDHSFFRLRRPFCTIEPCEVLIDEVNFTVLKCYREKDHDMEYDFQEYKNAKEDGSSMIIERKQYVERVSPNYADRGEPDLIDTLISQMDKLKEK